MQQVPVRFGQMAAQAVPLVRQGPLVRQLLPNEKLVGIDGDCNADKHGRYPSRAFSMPEYKGEKG